MVRRPVFSPALRAWGHRHRLPLLVGTLFAVFAWQWAMTLSDPRDFGVYYKTGARVISGAPIYDPNDFTKLSYKYSPVFAFLFVPLSLVPLKVAQTVWFAVNFLLTVALPPLAYALLTSPAERASAKPDHRLWVSVLALALASRYLLLNATAGQVVALQLALMLAGVLLVERDRAAAGGALLGLAILVKISPVLLLGHLLLRRRWSAIGWTILATAGWALVPALRYGFVENVRLHLEWLDFIQAGNTLDQLVRSQNQSMLSLLTRLVVETPYRINLIALPIERVTPFYGPVIFGGFALLLVALHVWLRRAPGPAQDARANVSLVAILIYMTISAPLAWRYNYLTILVPWVFVADRLLRGQRTRRTWAIAILSVALGALTTRDVLGKALETWTHVAGVEMWAGILAVYACVDLVCSRASEGASRTAPSGSPEPSPAAAPTRSTTGTR